MADNIPSLDDLLKSIQEEDDDNIPGLDDLLESIKNEDAPQSSSALAVVPKKPEDLVEEDIDSQILSILGLEDVFDLTYEEYASLLKEAAVKGRMANSQMTTGSIELVTNELKRVRGKTGKFKVKPKKVDINKVFNRKAPSPSSAIVKAQKLLPSETLEPETKPAANTENLQEDLVNGIGNILESLITIRTLLSSQSKTDQEEAKDNRKKTEKEKKKQREDTLEKKKPISPILKGLTKPVDDFFGAIKNFFKNVLLGSVVLGLFRWLKDPSNQKAIDGFTNFLQNNAGLILGGLLAIATLPLVPTILSLTGAISTVAIPALKAAFAFLSSPAGLLALGTAAGAGLGMAGAKGVEVLAKNLLYGGGDFTAAEESLDQKLFAAGMDKDGIPQVIRNRRRFKSGKPKTAEQEKIFKEVQSERNRIRKLRKERDAELKKLEEERDKKILEIKQSNSVRSGRGTKISTQGQRLIEEENQKFGQSKTSMNEKYKDLINKASTPTTPSVQPTTQLMPGLPPSASNTGSVVEYITGDATHPNFEYDGHGTTSNYHDHIAFRTKEDKERAKLALRQAGIQIGSENRPWDTDSYHGAGLAIDIPGFQWGGRGAIGETEYAGSRKVRAVLAAAGFSGAGISGGAAGTPSKPAQISRSPAPTPSIPSPTGRGNIVPLPIPTGGAQQASSGTSPNQASVPRFSSEDPNNTTTMVVRAIYNIVG